MSKPIASIRGLSVAYQGRTVLADVDLEIAAHQITAFVGPSGCGKTSLLSCMNRLTDLIGGCVVTGAVEFDGRNVLAPAEDVVALRRRVGMIFQKPNPFPFSVRRNLEIPLKEHGIRDEAQREAIIEKSLRDVGLWDEVADRLNSNALELSGGQQQRLCIARALSLDPQLLLFDEPCSALDPIASGVVEDLMTELAGERTLVVVTHNLAQARRIADHMAFFWTRDGVGSLIEEGPAARMWEAPTHDITAAYFAGVRG